MGSASPIKVLLADTHPQMRPAVERILGSAYRVRWVQSGEQLVDETGRWKPALLVLDVTLEGISGLDALRRLRARGKLPTSIVCSMIRDAPVLEGALQLGVAGYIYKAHAPFELLPAVDAVLAGRRFISDKIGPLPPETSREPRR